MSHLFRAYDKDTLRAFSSLIGKSGSNGEGGRLSPRQLTRSMTALQDRMANFAMLEIKGACNCLPFLAVIEPDELRVELNTECPVHGFREIRHFKIVAGYPGDAPDPRDQAIEALVSEYLGKLLRRG